MGWKVGITTLKLTNCRSKKSKAKRTGFLRGVVCEGMSERWGKDEDIDRSRSRYNTYTGVTSGVALAETMTTEGRRGPRSPGRCCYRLGYDSQTTDGCHQCYVAGTTD